MKKMIALLLCIVLLAGCVPAGAMTTDQLLASLSYILNRNRSSVAMHFRDERGNTLLQVNEYAGQQLSFKTDGCAVHLTGKGLFVEKDGLTRGVPMDEVLQSLPAVLPQLLGLPAITQKDIALFISIGRQFASAFTQDVVVFSHTKEEGRLTITLQADVDTLLVQADEAVTGVLNAHEAQIDDFLGRWSPALAQIIPGMPATAAGLKQLWQSLPLNLLRTGETVDICLKTGKNGAWRLSGHISQLEIDASFEDGHLRLWAGEKGDALFGFDTRDFAEFGEKLLTCLGPYLTSDVLDVGWSESYVYGKGDVLSGRIHVDMAKLPTAINSAVFRLTTVHEAWFSAKLDKYENTLSLFGISKEKVPTMLKSSVKRLVKDLFFDLEYDKCFATAVWSFDPHHGLTVDGTVGSDYSIHDFHAAVSDQSIHIAAADHAVSITWDGHGNVRGVVTGADLNATLTFDGTQAVLNGTLQEGNRYDVFDGIATVTGHGLDFCYNLDGRPYISGVATFSGGTLFVTLGDTWDTYTFGLGYSDSHLYLSADLPALKPILFELSLKPHFVLRAHVEDHVVEAELSDDRTYLRVDIENYLTLYNEKDRPYVFDRSIHLLLDVRKEKTEALVQLRGLTLFQMNRMPNALDMNIYRLQLLVDDVTIENDPYSFKNQTRVRIIAPPEHTSPFSFVPSSTLLITSDGNMRSMTIDVQHEDDPLPRVSIHVESSTDLPSVHADEWVSLSRILELLGVQ